MFTRPVQTLPRRIKCPVRAVQPSFKRALALRRETMQPTVLVTGASSGIGAAIARLFHRRGFMVFGTSRSADPNSPHEFPMLKLDVTSEASVNSCVGELMARAGRLDVLVNNAGF